MYTGGLLEVHSYVVFGGNKAETEDGGAVSLPFDTIFSILLWCFAIGVARADLIRQGSRPSPVGRVDG